MKNIIISVALAALSVSLVGCNEDKLDTQKAKEMDQMLQKGARDPVERPWEHAAPMGKMNPKTGLTENYSK